MKGSVYTIDRSSTNSILVTYIIGLVYCMDYLEKNIDWLQSKLEPLLRDHYLLFDFPGQAGKYVSALLLSLSTMLHLERPHEKPQNQN
ncbi:hypothetical protein Dimus_008025 [Dionaea muscipula]